MISGQLTSKVPGYSVAHDSGRQLHRVALHTNTQCCFYGINLPVHDSGNLTVRLSELAYRTRHDGIVSHRNVNKYSQTIFIIQYNNSTNLTVSSLLNIVPLLFNTFGPSLHKLLEPSEKKFFDEATSHMCSPSFTSWSLENQQAFKPTLS